MSRLRLLFNWRTPFPLPKTKYRCSDDRCVLQWDTREEAQRCSHFRHHPDCLMYPLESGVWVWTCSGSCPVWRGDRRETIRRKIEGDY